MSATGPVTVAGATTPVPLSLLRTVAPTPPPAPHGRPGDLVTGRYRLEHLIGAGGMGAVWAAHDVELDRSVAVKEVVADGSPGATTSLRESPLDPAHLLTAARAEADAARRARHPGVVQVHEVVGTSEAPWIVMERVLGASLANEVRRRGRLPRSLVADVAAQLIAAVAAVHAAGLVHRDVSPGNVLLTAGGRVVLTDFGLAASRADCDRPEPDRLLGSPPYVAPETLREGRSGPAADLFAVGATLYAAVEGRRPFDAGSPRATLRAVLDEPVPAMPHAGELEPLLRGLLAKDPNIRLTAGEAADRLAA